jgi:hypothetical protein
MQIGSGANYLPGCAPTPNAAPSATPPAAPPPVAPEPSPARGGRSHRKTVGFLLLAIIVAASLAGVFFALGRERSGAVCASVVKDVKTTLRRMAARLPGTDAATASNHSVARTPAQQRLVEEYSPIRPINEARRVKELEHNRVAGERPTGTTGAVAVAAMPVAAGATSTPMVLPKPAATRSGTSSPSQPPIAAPVSEKPFVWPAIRITATIGDQHGKWFARINGRLVTVGDTVDGAVVVAISDQCVTLRYNGQQRDYGIGAGR